MTIRSWTPAIALLLFLSSGSTPLTAERQAPESSRRPKHDFRGLEPGKFVTYRQNVPIDIVLIGFDDLNVGRNDIRSVLPDEYSPIVRYPQFYGLDGRNMGLRYSFEYSITRASEALTNRFFSYLAGIGTPSDRRRSINCATTTQATNVIDVTGPVLDIEATRVERWLEQNANPRRAGYTIYFINWYGRKDFRFHVYTKTGRPGSRHQLQLRRKPRSAPSPPGAAPRAGRGSTTSQPDLNGTRTTGWSMTTDLNGDGDRGIPDAADLGVLDLRLPLARSAGPRHGAADAVRRDQPALHDLAALRSDGHGARSPRPQDRRHDDVRGRSGEQGDGLHRSERSPRRGGRRSSPTTTGRRRCGRSIRSTPGAKNALEIFTENIDAPGCWVTYGTPFAQLFCYFAENLATYVPAVQPPRLRGAGVQLQHHRGRPGLAVRPARLRRRQLGRRHADASSSRSTPTSTAIQDSASPAR